MTNRDWEKANTLREDFRVLAIRFLEALDREGIPYLLGHARRTYEQELEIWKHNRQVKVGEDPALEGSWETTGKVRTKVFPGSGKGPHPYGLALDVYPKDVETSDIMADEHSLMAPTLAAMWKLAEEIGIDALGHDDPNRQDAVWSGDPCHYQLLDWWNQRMKEMPKQA